MIYNMCDVCGVQVGWALCGVCFGRSFGWTQDGVEVIRGRASRFGKIELIFSCFKRDECQIVENVGWFL